MREISCGTVLYTKEHGLVEYVLIQSYEDGYCGFPKGHMEGCETERETALRETWEEVSIRAEIEEGFRRETGYLLPNGNEKQVIYFLAHFTGQMPAHNPGFENKRILVLPYDQARSTLTYPDTKAILDAANTVLSSR